MHYDSVHRQRLVCGVDASVNSRAFRQDFKSCFGVAPTASDVVGTNASSHVATFFASYDAVGNLVQRGNTRYAYDTENRLLSVDDGSGPGSEVNVYDANGIRVIRKSAREETVTIDGIFEEDDDRALKHVKLGNLLVATIVRPASQTRLATKVVFPDDIPQLDSMTLDQNGASCGVAKGAGGMPLDPGILLVLCPAWAWSLIGRRRRVIAVRRVRQFLKGVGRHVLTRPGSTSMVVLLIVLQLLGGNSVEAAPPPLPKDSRFYYHTDHISSVQAITDQDGRVVRRQDYKPFGELISLNTHLDGPPAPSELNRSYQSKELDPTQLYYFGARHYDAIIGRFLTADSIIGDTGNIAAYHRYAFNLNNPIRYFDPTGHDWLDVVLGVVLVVLLVAAIVIAFIVPGTQPLGALLGSVALGILIGGFAGAVIGGIVAFTLLAEGKISLQDAFRLWNASILVGMLAGAAIGAICAGGIAAAAGTTAHIISGALIGAAVGASVGGAIGAAKGNGFGDDFLRGLLAGALVGAIVGGVAGFEAPGLATFIENFVNGLTGTTLLYPSASTVLVPILIAGGATLGATAGVFGLYCASFVGGPCLFAGENPFVKNWNNKIPSQSALGFASAPMTN